MQTGPKTAEGKAASSMNATKHGLSSNKVVLPGESRAAYDRLVDTLMDEHQPDSPTEALLVEEMAQAHWRLNRVRYRQDTAFESETLDAKLLTLLHRYATTYERSFFKALQTLKQLQKERLAQPQQTFVSQEAEQEAFFKMMDALTAPPKPQAQPPIAPVAPTAPVAPPSASLAPNVSEGMHRTTVS